MGATISRAAVVMPHGGRVTKATGLVLREWGALYPQAWAPAIASSGAVGGNHLSQTLSSVGGTLRSAATSESMVVVERQDAADWRRASGPAARVRMEAGGTWVGKDPTWVVASCVPSSCEGENRREEFGKDLTGVALAEVPLIGG